MKWVLKEISVGDMVRVPMREMHHYGVCTGEDTMIQFGEPILGNPKPKEEIRIMKTDIAGFLGGEFAEVAVLDKKELKQRRPIEEIIRYAESRLGEGGYDILYNNCEHFANECVFGLHRCSQVDRVREEMEKKLPPVFVYFASVDDLKENDDLPPFAKKELKRVTNQRVIDEKRAAYALLTKAAADCFGIALDLKKCTKDKNGKPHHRDICFSVSHSHGLVCVALAKIEVGCDIERLIPSDRDESIYGRIKTEKEAECDDTTLLWTKKEAIFKFEGGERFVPQEIDSTAYQTKSISLTVEGISYRVSVAAEKVLNVRWQNRFLKDAKIENLK